MMEGNELKITCLLHTNYTLVKHIESFIGGKTHLGFGHWLRGHNKIENNNFANDSGFSDALSLSGCRAKCVNTKKWEICRIFQPKWFQECA